MGEIGEGRRLGRERERLGGRRLKSWERVSIEGADVGVGSE